MHLCLDGMHTCTSTSQMISCILIRNSLTPSLVNVQVNQMTDIRTARDVSNVLKGVLKTSKGWKAAGVL